MMNFIFCSSEKLFISPSVLKNFCQLCHWEGVIIPARVWWSRSWLEYSENSHLMWPPMYVTVKFSLGFTYCARTSTLGLVKCSLNTGVDEEVCIKWQNSSPGDEHREQRVPFNFSFVCLFLRFVLHSNFPGSKSFIRHQYTNEQQISLFLAFTC